MSTASGRLAGKAALVTGAGSGIGRGIALAFAREGARVVVMGRRREPLEEVVAAIERAGGAARAVPGDVAREPDAAAGVREAEGAFGALHVLVNNAGVFLARTLAETTLEEWEQVFATNVRGAFLMARAALPAIARAGGGLVLNVSSNLGGRAVPGAAAYAASKAALDRMTESLALEGAGSRVRACSLRLGIVDTPIHDKSLGAERSSASGRNRSEWEPKAAAMHPLARIGTPEDAAAAAVYLASDEAAWTTGAVLNVDGGIGLV